MLDFLGIGAQKAGTTWIYDNLKQHPQIAFPHDKEIHFWDMHRGKGIDWYTNLFAGRTSKKQGEITPAYAFQDVETIEQIYKINPKLRLIYSVRDPKERAWSSAKMALGRAEMILDEASDQWFIDHFRSKGSLQRGDYLRCLRNWLDIFPAEQLLLLRYEDIATKPAEVLERCCKHIGVDPAFFAKQPERPKNKVNRGMEGRLRSSLLPVLHEIYDEKMAAFEHVVRTWQEQKSAPVQHFVMLFEGRTGSTMLTQSLASHPCIVADPERLVRVPLAEQLRWLNEFYSKPRSPIIRAVGFKTKFRDVADAGQFQALLEKHQVKVIHLHRKNLVKMAMSRINARRLFDERKEWNLPTDQAPLPPIEIPIAQFEEALAFKQGLQGKLQTFVDGLSLPVLSISYESLLAERQAMLAKIFDFLNVPSYPLHTKLQKNTPDDLRQALLNYDELKAHYKGTEFETMFE